MSRTTTGLLLVFFLSYGTPAISPQQVLKVPSQYKSIQAAINAAKNSDVVQVDPGTYWEQLDFLGKAITVMSTGGPAITKIRARGIVDVVTFTRNETRSTVLEGFDIQSTGDYQNIGVAIWCGSSPTIRNNILSGCRGIWISGSPLIENNTIQQCCIRTVYSPHGAGILVDGGSPEIVNNLISGNESTCVEDENFMAWGAGGGIYVSRGTVSIIGNMITWNTARAESSGWAQPPATGYYDSTGGGIYIIKGSTVLLANNIIARNDARTVLNMGPMGKEIHTSKGGGVFGDARLVNNTIIGNSAVVAHGSDATGGGLHGVKRVTNCIVRNNAAVVSPEIHGAVTVEYSNVKGGWQGTGNMDREPRFLDNEYHLLHDSPCRDKGTNTAPALPSTDRDGDPRVAYGTVDIGSDEFFPGFYHTGTPSPGNIIQVRIIGDPGKTWYWAFSSNVINPPVPLPGIFGVLHLHPGNLAVIPMGTFPATRESGFSYQFSYSFPRISIPIQALMGDQLSNLDWVHVR